MSRDSCLEKEQTVKGKLCSKLKALEICCYLTKGKVPCTKDMVSDGVAYLPKVLITVCLLYLPYPKVPYLPTLIWR